MATCVPFQSQVSSILEVMVRSAVAEISKLVDEKCAFLHLEISRKQSENELLKRKLQAMESKNAQLQQDFEKYLERGIALENSCTPVTGDMKFPDLHDSSSAPFTIKEESPEEPLWISEPSQNSGSSAVQFSSTSSSEGQPFEKNCHLEQTELNPQKNIDFNHTYNSPLQNMSQNFTIKTEKDENHHHQDSCQHGTRKPPQQQANINNSDFSMDERDTQLWSSIMDGNEIESGFPDFSSVVDEYSSSFSEQSDAVAKSANVSHVQSVCNGAYSNEYPKDASQSSDFQATFSSSHLQERDGLEGAIGNHDSVFAPGSYSPPNKTLPTARGYVCMQCGKAFGRLHQFKLHQQSHRRKRAFWCAVCGKSFQCSSHLRIHHRTHTGEKPYGCSVCGKRFTQQSSLRVHQRTHSGERPYSCLQCGKTFILMHHLKRHKIIHTYSG